MFSHFVKFLFIASMASYQVNAATTAEASPTVYLIGGSVEVTFTITVEKGTFTITYGDSGSGDAVGTVTVSAGGAVTFSGDANKPADVAVGDSDNWKIKVTKSSLVTGDNGKLIQLAYNDADDNTDTDAAENKDFTISLSCPAITGASGDNINVESSDTGTGCTKENYQFEDCVTVFNCVAGYSAAEVTSTCTDGAWTPAVPTCAATACAEIPAPTNGASTCTSGTSAKDDTCAITCNSGYSLTAGTANLTCQDSTDSAGKWSDATTPECTAVSCEKIPSPANGTSSCAASTTKVGSNCTITCDEGTKLSGSTPVTCETGTGVTGKWSNTTDKYSCDAVSGAGMIALNMMLALVLGTISSFMT